AVSAIEPVAYVVDDTGLPKDGNASPCVAHQYCGQLGKTTNCQVAVSIQLATDTASLAADWRLFCPPSWDDRTLHDPTDAAAARRRRAAAKLPDDARHREKWRLALDMLDETTGSWGLPRLPVTADCGYGDTTGFRRGLEDRGLDYVVAVSPDLSAHPADAVPTTPLYPGRGRPPIGKYPDKPSSLGALARAAGQDAYQPVTWRHGSRRGQDNPDAALRSRFLALPVRPANRDIPRAPDATLPVRTLLAQWPEGTDSPTDYWLSNLPADTPLPVLVRLAKIRWRVEHDYREL
ncbi:IS701 family transposase, partial [Frankia sp. Cr1]|uniref:IS701 family transposase n=1 Tax=Frankia sp. Cr1 TaxID=3073931 RepID=UPI002AD2B059